MPIVSSEIVKWRNKGNGRLSVFERHTDHNGDVHEHRYSCLVGHDINQALLDRIPKSDVSLITTEKINLQLSVEDGVDPANIILKHLTNTQKGKQVVKALMLGSPEKMLKAAEFVQGFTNTQIANLFSVDKVAKRMRIRVRQDYILNHQSVFDSDVREEL